MSGYLIVPFLIYAAISDLMLRRIPNGLVLALVFLWLLVCVVDFVHERRSAEQIAWALAAGVVVLVLGFALYRKGWMGAGDVKLLAALSLWLSAQVLDFVLATSLIGGLLVLAMPLVRRLEQALDVVLAAVALRHSAASARLAAAAAARQVRGIPYGVAIAAGAAWVLGSGQ